MYYTQLKHLTFSRTDTPARENLIARSLDHSSYHGTTNTHVYIGVYKTPRTEFVVLQHRKQLRDRRRQGRG